MLFGALPLVEVSCRTRDFKTLNMVASVEVTINPFRQERSQRATVSISPDPADKQ